MGFMHIDNLYRNTTVLQFDEIFALEKIHGTSAHIKFTRGPAGESNLSFYSGGEKYENFVALFNADYLLTALSCFGQSAVIIYGEAHGGKQQGMKDTYGPDLKFVVFDVKMGGIWLDVPQAETVARYLKLEFVDYTRGPATVEFLDQERDKDSTQAIRNGMGPGKMREGIVIRPIGEVNDDRGNRIIAKHKRPEFSETKTPRKVNPDKQKVLEDAKALAAEWVTPMRFQHVLDQAKALKIAAMDTTPIALEDTSIFIKMMIDDISREAAGEIVESKAARSAIGKATAIMFKDYIYQIGREAANEIIR